MPRKPTTAVGNRVTLPNGVTARHQLFVNEWLIHRDGKRAAIAAGILPQHAATRASEWLDPEIHPAIALYVKERLRQIEERSLMSAVEVQQYIATVMKYEPLKYFTRSDPDGGGWLVTLEELRALPPHIGCLIESFEMKEVTSGSEKEGNVRVEKLVKVKLVSKATAMTLAAKHQLGEKVLGVNVNVDGNAFPWDQFFGRPAPSDPVKEKLEGTPRS